MIGIIAWLFWKLSSLLMGRLGKKKAQRWLELRAEWALHRAEWWDVTTENGSRNIRYTWKFFLYLKKMEEEQESKIYEQVVRALWGRRVCLVDLAAELDMNREDMTQILQRLQNDQLVTVALEQRAHLQELPCHLVTFQLG